MASLPHAIKHMLQDVTQVDNDNITFGIRKHGGTLPAIYFMIESNDTMTVGTNNTQRRCSVSIKTVATTAEEALSVAMSVEDQLDVGTYQTIDFTAVINKNSMLESPESADGEEQIPFTAVTLCDIVYNY
jgi:hypothetical protein